MSVQVQVLVLAKQPVAGRVKTRLCPPFTPQGAADVAEPPRSRTPSTWCGRSTSPAGCWCSTATTTPPGFDVQPQRGGPMPDRLGGGLRRRRRRSLPDAAGRHGHPAAHPRAAPAAVDALLAHPAVLGRAPDGGWWALGLQQPGRRPAGGRPDQPGRHRARQLARLRAAGLDPHLLPELRDVDTVADARAVAALAPGGRFAAAVGALAP